MFCAHFVRCRFLLLKMSDVHKTFILQKKKKNHNFRDQDCKGQLYYVNIFCGKAVQWISALVLTSFSCRANVLGLCSLMFFVNFSNPKLHFHVLFRSGPGFLTLVAKNRSWMNIDGTLTDKLKILDCDVRLSRNLLTSRRDTYNGNMCQTIFK